MKGRPDHLPLQKRGQTIERRRSARSLCEGELLLFPDDDQDVPIPGVLCDISNEGFRAIHHGLQLSAGQLVRFQHAHGEGIATLVWTRVVGKEAESGFFVIDVRSLASKR